MALPSEAGAAAEHFAPASVIWVAGSRGAVCALAVSFSEPARLD
jgi:hypothetical protein